MRASQTELLQQAKQLWLTCFPQDSPDFVERYFAAKYTQRSHVYRLVDGRLAASALYLPFVLRLQGQSLKTVYVSGLCTHPDFRNRGLARDLLEHIHDMATAQGLIASLLIPGSAELRAFYERPENGAYATLNYRRRVEIEPISEIKKGWNVLELKAKKEQQRLLLQSAQLQTPNILLSGMADWALALDEALRSGGRALEVRCRQRLVALALLVPCAEGWLLRSFVSLMPDVEPILAAWLRESSGGARLFAEAPCLAADEGARPYMMGKVLRPSALVPVFGQYFSNDSAVATQELSALMAKQKMFSQNLLDE